MDPLHKGIVSFFWVQIDVFGTFDSIKYCSLSLLNFYGNVP
jgi:hypothetical protein